MSSVTEDTLAVVLSVVACSFVRLLSLRAQRVILFSLSLLMSILSLSSYSVAVSEGQGQGTNATAALAIGMICGGVCLLILIAAVLDYWLGPLFPAQGTDKAKHPRSRANPINPF